MNLREYLFYKNMTLTAAAKELAMSRTHLSQVAHGKMKPSKILAMYIEKYTGGEVTFKEVLAPWEKKMSSMKKQESI